MSEGKHTLLFINGHLNVGGVEKTLLDLLSEIDYSRYDVDLLLLQGVGDYQHRLPQEVHLFSMDTRDAYGPFIRTLLANLRSGRLSLIWFRIVSLIVKVFGPGAYFLLRPILPVSKKYDCAIAYRHGICAEIVAYSIHARKKLCWWHDGEFLIKGKGLLRMLRVWEHLDNIIAVSSNCRKALTDHFPDLSNKFLVLYNILDTGKITASSEPCPKEYDLSKTCIVSVGRLSPLKHFENALTVANNLLKHGINSFIWVIVGDGFEEVRLKALSSQMNLTDYVFFVGKKINPYPYIRYADFLVHTSYFEAHCTTILEAMALHTPCVVTKTTIPQDYTRDGYNCIEVERGPGSLLNGVMSMMNDPQGAERLAENAFKQVVRDYSPESVIDSFYSIVENS